MSGPDPRATYRVQLQRDFDFDDAAAIVGYLAELGISHLYCSPYLQAREGSLHGYDVVDHRAFNEELGGPKGHERLHRALEDAGLGQVLDIVPNHMAISDPRNKWWWDVLENGAASPYAGYFDIDWDSPEPSLKDKVLLAVLGNHYGRVLEAGELQLKLAADEMVTLHYYERSFPLSPGSLDALGGRDGWNDAIARVNADPQALHEILERQHYRLAYWRAASRELDYRRFFDVNDLAALRVEDPKVFDDVHWLIFRLVETGRVHGLRVDHVDGLRDPTGYLTDLREQSGAPYVVVEKILEPGERLLDSWPVDGTTGYDFLNHVGALFVDPEGEKPFDELYTEFTEQSLDLHALTYEKKMLVLRELLASDVERLTSLFAHAAENHLRFRDFTRHEMRQAIAETMASFDVYMTYIDEDDVEPRPEDVERVTSAIDAARDRRSDLDGEIFDFLRDILLMRHRGRAEIALALRFQQSTGPVMAKAVEDTVFYNFNRLISLNEVGGDPGRFGIDVDGFHGIMAATQERWPGTMLATSTHDTKRSEDVRARISLLSEMPDEWRAAVTRWAAVNERYRSDGFPDRNAEYLLYQTLVGAWPIETDRVVAYMEKASKEAKAETSWVDANDEYDSALKAFTEGALSDETFRRELTEFVAPLVAPGRISSLAQTLVKLTAPGVPDIYQGTEVWDNSLVDPDNRRPVDFAARAALLERLKGLGPRDVMAAMDEGAPKAWVIQTALSVRAHRPGSFGADGDYTPLGATGVGARHVVAFGRGEDVVTVVPRLLLAKGEWADTSIQLPAGSWRNAFGGETFEGRVNLAALLEQFPVALLESNA